MVDVNEKDEVPKSNSSPKEDGAQIVLLPSTVSSTSTLLVEKTVAGPGSTDAMEEGNALVGLMIDKGNENEKTLTEGETDNAQVVREVVESEKDEKTKEHIKSLKGKGSKRRKVNKKKTIAQKASEMVIGDSNEGNATVAAKSERLTIDENHDKEEAIGEEASHKEDAIKEASLKGDDVTEVAEREKDEKTKEHINSENLGGSLKGKGSKLRKVNKRKMVTQNASEMVIGDSNEGNAIVAAKNERLTIDENHDKEKAIGEEASHKEDAIKEASVKGDDVREVAEREKDEKTKEHINAENLGGSSRGKGSKGRNGNKKKTVAQKASEMVIGDSNEGNATVAAKNERLTVDENHDKEKAMGEEASHKEDAVKKASIKGDAVKEVAKREKDEKTKDHISAENLYGSSKGKGSKHRNVNKKEVAQKSSEMVIGDSNEVNATIAAKNEGLTIDENLDNEKAIGEEITHEVVKEASIKGEVEGKTEEKKKGENLGEGSNRMGRRPRRNRKKEVAQKASEIVGLDGDKPESSSKKKASEKVKSMGMVFMCSSKTKADCFRYKILGQPAGKKDQVAKVYKGMRLFLFDVDLRLMYGIFKAAGAGGYNIEPKAFKSAYPSQVRFTMMEDCLPLAEEKFRNVLKENYYSRNKFECQLNAQQVRKLCKLFVAAKSGPSRKKAIKNHRSGADETQRARQDAHTTARDGKKRKRWAPEEETQPHPSLGRDRRRYHDYGHPHVRYEQEALLSPVRPVARYLPAPPPDEPAPVRSYGYEGAYSYAPRHHDEMVSRSYRVLDTEPRHRDEMVSRQQEHDRERHHLYHGREPLMYRDDEYPFVGQRVEYHHHPPPAAAVLPSQYRLVSREYPPPPATEEAEYRLSGGLQAAGYRDVGHASEYRSSFLEYNPRGRPSRYGY